MVPVVWETGSRNLSPPNLYWFVWAFEGESLLESGKYYPSPRVHSRRGQSTIELPGCFCLGVSGSDEGGGTVICPSLNRAQGHSFIFHRLMWQHMSRRSILLYGLSANPPTGYGGHVGLVQHFLPAFDEIWVVPVYQHPYPSKSNHLVSYEHRVQMCQLAFGDLHAGTDHPFMNATSRVECLLNQSSMNRTCFRQGVGATAVCSTRTTRRASIYWYHWFNSLYLIQKKR